MVEHDKIGEVFFDCGSIVAAVNYITRYGADSVAFLVNLRFCKITKYFDFHYFAVLLNIFNHGKQFRCGLILVHKADIQTLVIDKHGGELLVLQSRRTFYSAEFEFQVDSTPLVKFSAEYILIIPYLKKKNKS